MATNVILDCEDEFEENDSGSSFSSTSSFEDGDECSRAEESCEVIGFNFEPSTDEESDEEDPTQDIRRLLSTDWCKCDHCVPMGTIKESRCCQEIDLLKFAELLAEGGNIKCITQHPGFKSVCLDPYVLRTCYTWHKQQHKETVRDQNNRWRYMAYRMLVRFVWGYLGKDIRVTLPACAVHLIREKFPSADGKYTGFLEPDV